MPGSQQLGRELIIKMGDRATVESFENLCGFLARSFSMSSEEVDTTIPDCDNPGGPVIKTSYPGVQDQSFEGSGLFKNASVMARLVDNARNSITQNYQIVVPGYGTFEGPYAIFGFEFSGDKTGSMEFSCTWRPTSPPTFTAA